MNVPSDNTELIKIAVELRPKVIKALASKFEHTLTKRVCHKSMAHPHNIYRNNTENTKQRDTYIIPSSFSCASRISFSKFT